ncbi:hypothetical protein AVEN_58236-1 [Araneus ventricosus]|uniref:Uncharacterized protein n=1 Tax=Araneus ventricosus TaxID=182803 RepID=A0A4Y2JSU2_ARAVE|nr:hypothetical protein AVEN_58236-1 [Araneus ventricosus]
MVKISKCHLLYRSRQQKIENAIAILEFEITSAIKLASRIEAVNTTHYKLPSYITRKITYKNHIRILHQLTRYPPNKYEVNRLGEETEDEIPRWDQKKWTEAVLVLNSEDHAVYGMVRKLSINIDNSPHY